MASRGVSLEVLCGARALEPEFLEEELDIHEDDQLDEAKLATWFRQAAALPGWVP
jgi:hypothetical protein